MKRPDEDERLFMFLIVVMVIYGAIQDGIQRDVRLLDARVTNIEAAKP